MLKKITSKFSCFPIVSVISICFILIAGSANAKPDAKKASLGDLDCTIDQIAKWDGNAWVCAEDTDTTDTDWKNLTDVPADIYDGDDDTNTNAMTECGDSEVLLGSGACLAISALQEQLFKTRTIFVTSEIYDGNLGGVAGADEKCQSLADSLEAIVPAGNYIALISSDHIAANSLIDGMGRIINSRRQLVAGSPADLFAPYSDARTLIAPIGYDETGEIPDSSTFAVWTGSREGGNGTFDDPASYCSNWTTANSEKFAIGPGGLWGKIDSTWIGRGLGPSSPCNTQKRLYCILQ